MGTLLTNRIFDDVFSFADLFSNPIFNETEKLLNNGLKRLISRPHNLVDIYENGKTVAQRLEVVTTPFSKDEVTIEIDKNVLTVNCGSENVKDKENETTVYRGISGQTYSFSLTLPSNIDKSGITAVNKDGVLKINLPFLKTEQDPEVISVKID